MIVGWTLHVLALCGILSAQKTDIGSPERDGPWRDGSPSKQQACQHGEPDDCFSYRVGNDLDDIRISYAVPIVSSPDSSRRNQPAKQGGKRIRLFRSSVIHAGKQGESHTNRLKGVTSSLFFSSFFLLFHHNNCNREYPSSRNSLVTIYPRRWCIPPA